MVDIWGKEYDIFEDNIPQINLSNINYCSNINEINNRYLDVIQEIDDLKIDVKSVKRILSKIRPLLTSMEVIEDIEPEDNLYCGFVNEIEMNNVTEDLENYLKNGFKEVIVNG